jgi:hypothetical protein
MGKALLGLFGRRPQASGQGDVEAVTALNARMQRILECHARLNVQPRALPQASPASEKAS